ncbi:ABC transporter ATP-binding protein [Candidatus Leptofilum sp.]|uniref:ABC transporter ATP-binding protein n=1 Tax=Candidatus Leptofilum sp. TaxID=3241576 RepID=UPI003B59FE82
MSRSEFSVTNAYRYDHRSTFRWLQSHILRYKGLLITFLLTTVGMAASQSMTAVTVGWAFDSVIQNEGRAGLILAALYVVAAYVGYGLFDIVNSLSIRVLAQRVERNARDELYLSLLSKSQTFHGQQRVGDLMARATNDVQQINLFVSPALGTTTESILTLLVPLVTITTLDYQLLIVPVVFLITTYFALRRYNNNLAPVATQLRGTFAEMNAGLAETISGIEVVKGFAQEPAENTQFSHNAGAYRDAFVREGEVTARYLPLLLYGLTIGLGFGHALYLFMQEIVTVGQVIAFMALLGTLRMPIRFLLRNVATFQQSFASARRILEMILTETELDQNEAGVAQEMRGEVVFEDVSFGYGEFASGESASIDPQLALRGISFRAKPGQTMAIVGQTGAGKSTLTKLLNRTFDVGNGRILIDQIDVRDWSLDSLRGQIGTIEQDIFLFSRTIAENIAFGAKSDVPQAEIEAAAKQAQAHDFIMSFPDGYQTMIGERGVMLSGGQRQRLAIARAFLSDPRILVLDDSTSAIDSNTEDQIQRAMHNVLAGRTTLLITHRLSQIRRADLILLMKNGRLIAQGTHEELMDRSAVYQQIFVR